MSSPKVKIYSVFSPAPRRAVVFSQPTMAQQHFKDECDINTILKRYERTGFLVDPLKAVTRQPQFGDFTAVPDFLDAQNLIASAHEQFDALPSAIRKRFHNDPAEFLEFMNDSNNLEEAVKLGLVERPIEKSDNSTVVSQVVEPVTKASGGADLSA